MTEIDLINLAKSRPTIIERRDLIKDIITGEVIARIPTPTYFYRDHLKELKLKYATGGQYAVDLYVGRVVSDAARCHTTQKIKQQ